MVSPDRVKAVGRLALRQQQSVSKTVCILLFKDRQLFMHRLTLIALAFAALTTGVMAFLLFERGSIADFGARAGQYEQLTALPHPRALPAFSLTDQTGAAFEREDFAGRWSVLFFGFTQCPDICPTTLYQLANMQKSLEMLTPAKRPAVFMISVDVARDTPQVMAQYVQAFDSSFTGITGDAEELHKLASALGVAYGTEAREDGGYDVLHTAALFFLNNEGDFVAIASAPHDTQSLARDYQKLLKDSGS